MFMQFTTAAPAGEQGMSYRAIAGGYAWPARRRDAAVIARPYDATVAFALSPGGGGSPGWRIWPAATQHRNAREASLMTLRL